MGGVDLTGIYMLCSFKLTMLHIDSRPVFIDSIAFHLPISFGTV